MIKHAEGDKLYNFAKNVLVAGCSASGRWNSALKRPFYIKKGKGSHLMDLDGNEFIDMDCSHGASIFGHGHPVIMKAIKKALEIGIICSYETKYQSELAEKICKIVPAAELCRFTCSGTEATMHAIRLAREFTGKDLIIKFEGHFHGFYDYVHYSWAPSLKEAGPYENPNAVPFSGGIPKGIEKYIKVLPFNNLEILEKTIKENKDKLAAVILEPINYNMGCIIPDKVYIKAMRELTKENDIILIFDEILSAFRMGPGCAQEYLEVTPDLCTIGKCVAGGTPLSIITGKKEIMEHFKPIGKTTHSGTYTGHSISVMAANAAMDEIVKPYFYKHIYKLADKLYGGLKEIFSKSKLNIKIQGLGARFGLYFNVKKDIIKEYRDIADEDTEMNLKFHELMLKRNVYFNDYGGKPSHKGFSIQHTLEDIDEVLNRTEDAVKNLEKIY